ACERVRRRSRSLLFRYTTLFRSGGRLVDGDDGDSEGAGDNVVAGPAVVDGDGDGGRTGSQGDGGKGDRAGGVGAGVIDRGIGDRSGEHRSGRQARRVIVCRLPVG